MVVSKARSFGGNAFEDVIDKAVHIAHHFAGYTDVRADLLQDFVNVDTYSVQILSLFLATLHVMSSLAIFFTLCRPSLDTFLSIGEWKWGRGYRQNKMLYLPWISRAFLFSFSSCWLVKTPIMTFVRAREAASTKKQIDVYNWRTTRAARVRTPSHCIHLLHMCSDFLERSDVAMDLSVL